MLRRVRLTSAVKMDSPHVIVGDVNSILTLSMGAALFAVANNLGVFHGGDLEDPGPTRAQLEAEEAKIGTLKRIDDGQTHSEPTEAPVPEDEPEAGAEAAEPPKRPYGNAPKSAWVRYAVSVDPDLTEERADTWTKADLMSKFGSRLGEED